ncbi:MAG: metal-dependent hydrolase [Nanoarchaeota archaeon]
MLRKTHLAIGLAAAIYFLPHVTDKTIFFIGVVISTLLPDLDRMFGFLRFPRQDKSGTPNHRGFMHSYTFCILIAVLLAMFYPILALSFFLGYSLHLFADSFTVKGIKPFWPINFVSSGKITTGSKVEDVVFWIFVMIDVFLLVFLFF